nr:putative ribonuclease H-like domain-containing protein [Tanacetum cinerariifolium]
MYFGPVSAGRPTSSAGRPVFAGRLSVPAGRILRKVTASASSERFPRASSVENSYIHDGLKIFDCPKSCIFTISSYDEDFSGPDANNLESSLNALADPDWVEAMQAEMQQFRNQKVWVLVTLPDGKRAIGTKWILKNKRDARGIVCINKARLVAQGHRQEEGIDYTDVFSPVARIKAIRLFLAFASFIGFMVYQMDVKSAFLYGKIAEDVYVRQPRGFEDPDHPKKSTRLSKPCMAYIRLLELGLQVDQRPHGIFIHQEKEKNVPDEPIYVHIYRSMIGCLMYLTATRPDIMFVVCVAARHQVTPKTSNLLSVKRIINDYAGAHGDRKSTTGGCQFLGRRLISWPCKKQTIVATSSYEAEYVATASCCGQLVVVVSIHFCWSCDFLLVVPHSCWCLGFCWSYIILASNVLFLLGSASEVSLPDGVKELVATIDGTAYTVTEASIRSALQLDDLNAIDTMTNEEIFAGLGDIGYATEGKFMFFKNKFSPQWKFLIHTLIHCLSPKSGSWNQFASNIAIALICLSTGRKYNFSNMILMDTTPYPAPLVTKKFFANMRHYQGPDMPLLAHMLNQGEPAFVQAQQQEVSPPQLSPVVAPHPSPDPMPSPPRQSSPPPIPFGLAPSSRVASTEPIPDIPSSSRPYELVLETITSPIRDDDTDGGSFHESPPSPPPATPPRSPTEGVAEEPLTQTSLLALFPTCLQRIATLEAELKATKILHRDTVVLFAKRIKKLESKLKTKKRARAATIIYKCIKKQQSSSGLDFTDAAIPAATLDSAGGLDSAGVLDSASVVVSAGGADSASGHTSAGILVAIGPSVPAKLSSPIRDPTKGKAVATPSSPIIGPTGKELADQ